MTPHKVSVCILLQIYAPPAQTSLPFPFSSVSQHNSLGIYLLSLTKSSDDIIELKLEGLIAQLRKVCGELSHWLADHLTSRLSSLSSPDDLFNFFTDLRGFLGGPDSNVLDDDQTILDPNSNLGIFLRCSILAFNLLSFEGVCDLLTNLGTYSKVSPKSYDHMAHMDDIAQAMEPLLDYERMESEDVRIQKFIKKVGRKRASESIPFHNHAPKALIGFIGVCEVYTGPELKRSDKQRQASHFAHPSVDSLEMVDPSVGVNLRPNLQIQGYLMEQAVAIEKNGSSFPLNAFESVLKQIQKLAPELHRVHFMRYLNSLYHDDYPTALENLHRYFDYSAGIEGVDPSLPGCNTDGRYEGGLLFLGMMHFHFGHPRLALEVLTEAVRACQEHSDDVCLANTLAVICNLLSEVGISGMSGVLGASYSPATHVGTSVSVQQQLFLLLQRSLKRAESSRLKSLIASTHIAMARFNLTHVQRPLLSFGPNASMKLRTCPANVCQELRLSSHLISDFGSENSTMITDGIFSSAWLKNLQKPIGSSIFSEDNASDRNSDAFRFLTQPNCIPGSVLQLTGSSYLVRATTWELHGSAPLARINSLVHATCFAESSSLADAALAYSKLVQHLAVYKGYKEAFAALSIAEDKFLSVSKSRFLLLKLQLLHERALHCGHLKKAQQLCDELGVLASSVAGMDMELKIEASLRHARTLLSANQFSQAAAVAQSLFSMCYKFNMQVENATVLLLLAEIHKRSGNAVLGIPYALASLSFCQSFNLDLLKASVTLTLAELWLLIGSNHAKWALSLLHGAFPMILGHGGLELCARAYIAEAKCYLSDTDFSVYEDPEVVLDPLRQAAEEIQCLEYHELAAEAFYLMATVFDKLGKMDERKKAATLFKEHTIALENPQDRGDIFFGLF